MSFQHLSYDNINNIFEYLKNNELKNVITMQKKYYKFSKNIMTYRKNKHEFYIECINFFETYKVVELLCDPIDTFLQLIVFG